MLFLGTKIAKTNGKNLIWTQHALDEMITIIIIRKICRQKQIILFSFLETRWTWGKQYRLWLRRKTSWLAFNRLFFVVCLGIYLKSKSKVHFYHNIFAFFITKECDEECDKILAI